MTAASSEKLSRWKVILGVGLIIIGAILAVAFKEYFADLVRLNP